MKTIKLMLLLLLMLVSINIGYTQTLHALIFADTNSGGKVGESVMNDYNSINDEIANIQTATGLTLNPLYFNEDACDKETLLGTLKGLKCQPNDVVIFYYSGHGGRAKEDASVFPQLVFDNTDTQAYPLYKIDEAIESKRPRFRLIIADCCNSDDPGMSVKSVLTKGKSIVSKANINVYKELFLNTKGSVVIASSKAGQTSGICEVDGMLRGTFTVCLENELEKLLSGNGQAKWKSLLENTQTATMNYTANSVVHRQTPVFEIKLDGENSASISPSTTAVAVPQTNNLLIASLIKMADNGESLDNRIAMVQPILNQWFSSNAIVEVFGRSGKLRLTRETAKAFLERISIAYKLINFAELEKQLDNNGKITYLKLHEIYTQ
jgi:hypothetical protein